MVEGYGRTPGAGVNPYTLLPLVRFGEGLRIATDKLDSKNFYAFNPEFDKPCNR